MEEQPRTNGKEQRTEHDPEVRDVTAPHKPEEAPKTTNKTDNQLSPSLYRIALINWSLWRARRHHERPDRAKFRDTLMVIATCVMALATIAISILAGLQWRDSSKLNDAATKAANAADKFKDSAAHIERIIRDAQGNMQTMADSSRQSIQATQDAMRLDQRAWVAEIGMAMDAPEIGKKLQGYVLWSNSGKSFAKKVKPLCHFAFVPAELVTEDGLTTLVSRGTTAVGFASIGVLAPNAQYKTQLESVIPANERDKDRISGDWYTYIWGELTYDDVFKQPHTTIFCSYRQGATADFVQCPFHNDAN